MGKAQIALEFLLLTAFSSVLLIALFMIVGDFSSSSFDMQRTDALKDLGNSIREEVVAASEKEPGYHRTFELPKTVKGKSYTLTLDEGGNGTSFLTVHSENYEVLYPVPRITGTLGPGENIIIKETNLTAQNI